MLVLVFFEVIDGSQVKWIEVYQQIQVIQHPKYPKLAKRKVTNVGKKRPSQFTSIRTC